MTSLLIACSDGSVAPALRALEARLGIEDADRLLVPGGPLQLIRAGIARRVALDCVRGLIEAHGVRRICLVSHQECAAYESALGGLGFDQRELLERDLRRARALLESSFTGIEVSCYFVPWCENGGVACFGAAESLD